MSSAARPTRTGAWAWRRRPSTPATGPTRRRARSTPRSMPVSHVRAGRCGRSARRIRIRPHRQPDPGRAGGVAGRGRGRHIRPGVQLGDGRHRLCTAGAAASRRPRGHPRRRVRRHVPADRQGVHGLGCRRTLRSRCPISMRSARRLRPTHPADLGRDTHEPAAVDRRYRRDRRARRRALGERCWWTTPLRRRRCSSR